MKWPNGWIRVHRSRAGGHDRCPFSFAEDDSPDGSPARGHGTPFGAFAAGCGARACASRPLLGLPAKAGLQVSEGRAVGVFRGVIERSGRNRRWLTAGTADTVQV
jgi:hypothetical protein